jgi:hypothetical protein
VGAIIFISFILLIFIKAIIQKKSSMKKHQLLAAMILFLCSHTFAQQPDSKVNHNVEIRAGLGVLTIPEIGTGVAAAVSAILVPVGYTDIKINSVVPAIPVSILFKPDNRFSYGADFIINNMSSEFTYSSGPAYIVKSNFFTIMLRGDYHYVNNGNFKLYGSVAAGPSFFKSTSSSNSNTTSSTKLGYHFTPLGLRFGGTFAGWAELGIGYRGLLSAGLAYRF